MSHVEKDKTPAPPLIEVFEKRNIKGVAFDLDSTLLDTGKHFHDIIYSLSMEVLKEPSLESNFDSPEETTIKIEQRLYEIYRENGRRPTLIGKQFRQALATYLPNHLKGQDLPSEIEKKIDYYQKQCYETSPDLFEGTIRILEIILEYERLIAQNSNAQENWTKIKNEYISDSLKERREIPYVAVPITEDKGPESWLETYSLMGLKPEEVMTVGDNFMADIWPAMKAGCKNLVWVNPRGEAIPEGFEISEDTHLYVIEDISDMEFLSDSDIILK